METLLKAINTKPNAWTWFTLGLYYGDKSVGLDNLSLYAYENAAEIDPLYPYVHTAIGHGYSQRKQWEEAVKSYEKALKNDPFDPSASTYIVGARKELDKQTPL